ncbi:acetyl-CoA C-acyltransferase [Pseudomaricurvus alkylphenolicus]|jgi:acetyl-CoA C-acetyltransferase|uniref:acetyl-CoA C-acyltransferase n=1 Tax=Pseudomaricurvus alkylphenolicus TaxID=1306991 RepID=UPI00141DB640|nr:acetyl-CoA C-acyltransferase [Pseudomaricurvus alkylphenolicus]NIB39306.1 acetyl-CoA C-acyltransferase [Pseudomaricurvus alkylphenolicus]
MTSETQLSDQDVVIVAAARTPMGGFQGAFASQSAPELGAAAIKSLLERTGLQPDQVEEVLMGNVLNAGVGQAPARQAALGAGLDLPTRCTTVSKVCGSGMKAAMLAHDQIRAGSCDIAIAGGMESMTKAPYFIAKARDGLRLGHGEIKDHMFVDGLEDAYTGRAMGTFAQEKADAEGITREQMDEYALQSLSRANQAIEEGWFEEETVPVTFSSRRGEVTVTTDEQPGNARPDKIPGLKPAFAKDGTITAANSSSISDGAAALLLMSAARARQLNLQPLAKICGHTGHAQHPSEFTITPIAAIRKLLNELHWHKDDVDLFEINEAFAMVAMLAIRGLDLDIDKVNINGGACALGHPIGASGARILVTLIYALKRLGKKRGVASLCIGGGEATAIAIEML